MAKLEEILGIDIHEDTPGAVTSESSADVMPTEIKNEIYGEVTIAEKIEQSLTVVTDLDLHDKEMDDISQKAMETYHDLIALGSNISDAHAGKIYEVAGAMLKTAMEARDSKLNRKLKMIELQLKKHRIDKLDAAKPVEDEPNKGVEFDRNELLAHIQRGSLPKDNE